MFNSAPKVHLATGGAFAGLEVDGDGPVFVSGVDIANAFYTMELSEYFRQCFGMPKIRAGLAGVTHLVDGTPVSPHDLVTPCFKCPPMGWNMSLWICQTTT